jgi:chemotaxis family two-component system response regulator Rcp1
LSNRANVLHILLVEDNTADVMLVREALRSCSIAADVIIAYDGEQALKFLDKLNFRPDFVLLDLNIPKFDGYVVLDKYHQQGGPPVIVLTASDREEDKQRALALGARDYVVKPRGLYDFISAVHAILERWQSEMASQAAEG